jgi:putative membrane protein
VTSVRERYPGVIESEHIRSFFFIMRIVFSLILTLLFGYTSLIPFATASAPSADILAVILKGQGVTDKSALDCTKVTAGDAENYGEAFFTEMIDTNSSQYQAILKNFPVEKRNEIFRGMGLQNLGCIGGGSVAGKAPTIVAEEGIVSKAQAPLPPRTAPLQNGGMGFFASWTMLVWMFSALGFAVFMVWITSSKFRFQFRKMAEGEFDMNDKAMSILKERFARGEITKEQFDKMRRDILN